jgi:hypothetical protein
MIKSDVLDLIYPALWKPNLNPFARESSKMASDWFCDLGIVNDTLTSKLLQEERADLYAGYPYPTASLQKLTTVCQFLSLWILFDDLVVENSTDYWNKSTFQDYVRLVHEGTRPTLTDPFMKAWGDLFSRFRNEMSTEWTARVAGSFITWLKGALHERELFSSLRKQNHCPSWQEYLRVRSVSVGVLPTFQFIEYVEGFELPESCLKSDLLQSLHDIGTRIIFLANDIMSLEKDLDADWPNAVTSIQKDLSLSLRDAVSKTVTIHNEYVSEFLDLESKLFSPHRILDPRLQKYVEKMHFVIRGFAEFEGAAERYQRTSYVQKKLNLPKICVR